MNSSQEVGALGAALSKAQGEMGNAKKGQVNPFFKSTYADLASVWSVCREPLSNNELSVIQATDVKEDDRILLRTVLLHSSGQWVSSNYPINPVKPDPQGIGSAITYARRYALMAMIGIAPEDDDGEKATGRGESKEPDKRAHWCTEHETEFFKRGKMKSYAHPIGDTGEWCHEHKEPAVEITATAVKDEAIVEVAPPIDMAWIKERLAAKSVSTKEFFEKITLDYELSISKTVKEAVSKLSAKQAIEVASWLGVNTQ